MNFVNLLMNLIHIFILKKTNKPKHMKKEAFYKINILLNINNKYDDILDDFIFSIKNIEDFYDMTFSLYPNDENFDKIDALIMFNGIVVINKNNIEHDLELYIDKIKKAVEPNITIIEYDFDIEIV